MKPIFNNGKPLYTQKHFTLPEIWEDMSKSYHCNRGGPVLVANLPLFPKNTYRVKHGEYELEIVIPYGEYQAKKPDIIQWLNAICALAGHRAKRDKVYDPDDD